MASIGVAPTSGLRDPSGNTAAVDKLPDEMNDMKIKDEKVSDESSICQFEYYLLETHWLCFHRKRKQLLFYVFQEMEATVVDGNGTETGHIIVTTIGGKNGQPKQVILFKFFALF